MLNIFLKKLSLIKHVDRLLFKYFIPFLRYKFLIKKYKMVVMDAGKQSDVSSYEIFFYLNVLNHLPKYGTLITGHLYFVRYGTVFNIIYVNYLCVHQTRKL